MLKNTEFELAFQAANGAYALESGGGFLRNKGYEFVDKGIWIVEETGLEAALYNDSEGNYILAFAGSEGAQDWYQNLSSMGFGQWDDIKGELYDFFEGVIANEDSQDGINSLTIAGHSLGGALAQYAAYDLHEQGFITPDKLKLITFNGLGGVVGLEKKYGNEFDSSRLNGATIHNYFNPSDLVVQLSEHLGGQSANYQLIANTETEFFLDAHSIETISEQLRSGQIQINAQANHNYYDLKDILPFVQKLSSGTNGLLGGGQYEANEMEATARLIAVLPGIAAMEAFSLQPEEYLRLRDWVLDNFLETKMEITDPDDRKKAVLGLSIAISYVSTIATASGFASFIEATSQIYASYLEHLFATFPEADVSAPVKDTLFFSMFSALSGASLNEQGLVEGGSISRVEVDYILDEAAEHEFYRYSNVASHLSKILDISIDDDFMGYIELHHQIIDQGIQFGAVADGHGLSETQLKSWIAYEGYNDLSGRIARYSVMNNVPFILLGPEDESRVLLEIRESKIYAKDTYSEQYWDDRVKFYQLSLSQNAINLPYGDIFKGEYELYQDLETGAQAKTYLFADKVDAFKFGSDQADAGDIDGGDYNDHLYGREGDDTINGNAGRDYIEGNAGNDTLHGGSDTDYLYGGTGNDHLHGDEGNDYLFGGEGADTYYYVNGDGNDSIHDNDGLDKLVINGNTISQVTQTSNDSTIYQDDYDNTYVIDGSGEMLITVINGNQAGTINIDWFHKDTNNFGITVNEPKATVLPVTTYVVGNDNLGATYGERIQAGQSSINNQGIEFHAETAIGVGIYNGEGEFTFEGGDLGDNLIGGIYADKLNGLAGDDYISGLGGTDFLDGGLGSDTILGGEGIDFLSGNNINKSPYGDSSLYVKESEISSDFISGGEGNDVISGDEGSDILLGGSGNDSIAGGDGADIISGGSEDDNIFGDSNRTLASTSFDSLSTKVVYIETTDGAHTYDDVIDGGEGNDHIVGEIGNDTIQGGSGDDWIMGDRHAKAEDLLVDGAPDPDFVVLDSSLHGDDNLFGGAGNDTIAGNAGDDYIDGGTENDFLWGDDQDIDGADHGKDTLVGGTGNDQLIGGGEADVLYGGDGQDLLIGDEDVFDGETTIALEGAYHGKDELHGGYDNDSLIGGGNADQLFGDSGNDVIFGDSLFDNPDVYGNAINYSDTAVYRLEKSHHGNDLIDAGSGDDWVYGGDGDDTIKGGSGVDVLKGQEGNDNLDGGSGDDFVIGGLGNDTLTGGSGNDYLRGGDGQDTYVFRSGDEGATIVDGDGITINFDEITSASDLTIHQNNNDVVISYSANTSDYVIFSPYTLQNIDAINIAGDEQLLEFEQEITVLNSAPYLPSISGTRLNDTFVVDQNSGIFSFKNHGDSITTDTLRLTGVSADEITVRYDFLYGNGNALGFSTNEYVNIYGAGFNVILGDFYSAGSSLGIDQIVFDDGTTWSTSDMNLKMTSGTDKDEYIPGTQVDNLFVGRKGDDILGVGQGGTDTVQYNLGDGWDTVGNLYGFGNVVIEFGEGIRPEDLILNKSSATNAEGGFNIYIEGVSGGIELRDFYSNASDYQFSFSFTGDVWNVNDILGQISASEFDDLLIYPHPYHPYVVAGLGGDDELSGSLVNDELSGGAGQDLLKGNSGEDILSGGSGDDQIFGGNGNDLLDGGAGNDYLDGESGQDTYVLRIGSNKDYISTSSDANGLDELLIVGVHPEFVMMERSFNDLIISLNENDAFTIENYFDSNVSFGAIKFDLDEGSVWLPDDVDTFLGQQVGTEIISDAVSIIGTDGNDRIISSTGAVIDAGSGYDYIASGSGADTILFGRGGGQKIVQFSGGNDTIQFNSSLTPNDLNIYFEMKAGGTSFFDLIIEVQGTDDKLRLVDFTVGDESTYRFYFPATEQTLSMSDLPKLYQHSDHADYLFAKEYSHNSEIYLGDGNDVITIRSTGQSGVIYGSNGDDHYTFDRNYETWVIDDHEGENIIQLNMSPASSSNVIERQGADLIFRGVGDTEHVTIKDFFLSGTSNEVTPNTVSKFRFLDYEYTGSFWTVIDVLAHLGIIDPASDPNAVDDIPAETDNVTPISIDVLSNDSDINSDDILTVVKAWASNGTVVINPDGSLNYTSDVNFVGADVIGYALSDGAGGVDVAHVMVNVNAANDTVVALDDTATTNEDTSVTIDVLANDTDPDGDSLTIDSASAINGSVIINPEGTLNYTPNTNFNGSDTINYEVSDGNGGLATSTVAVTVNPENDVPVLSTALTDQTTTEGELTSFVISSDSFTDIDAGDALTYSASRADGSSLPDWLSFDSSTLAFSGTPSSSDIGELAIKVLATDSSGAAAEDIFNISVLIAEDQPLSIIGTRSAEVFHGGSADDYINAKGGKDQLFGYEGKDTLIGGGGSDHLYGGDGVDKLKGGGGNDHLYGETGNDVLVGGAGNDHYYFGTGDGFDRINNASNKYANETDSLNISGVVEEDLWFKKTKNHLDVYLLGSTDRVRVNNWYKEEKFELDRIDVGSSSIDSTGIEQLVNAMASFGAPSGGSIDLTPEDQYQVQSAIAAAWA